MAATEQRSYGIGGLIHKKAETFFCDDCLTEITGWRYSVGIAYPRSVCAGCWALPRIPPMRPIGLDVLLVNWER